MEYQVRNVQISLEELIACHDDQVDVFYSEVDVVITDQNATVLNDKFQVLIPLMPARCYDAQKTKYENVLSFLALRRTKGAIPDDWMMQSPEQLLFVRYRQADAVGCQHYVTSANLRCRECQKLYACARCHNERESHPFEFQAMQCSLCGAEASQLLVKCPACAQKLGTYACQLCSIICTDSPQSRPAFHCQHCGMCEIGSPATKRFCPQCRKCFLAINFDKHKCVSSFGACPICRDQVDVTQDGRVELPCGHSLHKTCRAMLMRYGDVRCPECRKLALTGRARQAFELLLTQRFLEEALPPVWENQFVWFSCNECGVKFLAHKHPVGARCSNPSCCSFNTTNREAFNGKLSDAMQILDAQNRALERNGITPIRPVIDEMVFYQRFFSVKFQLTGETDEAAFQAFLAQLGIDKKDRLVQVVALNRLFVQWREDMTIEQGKEILRGEGFI